MARALLIQGASRPLRILCTREIQKSIAESVHKLLCDQIEGLNLNDFYQVTQTSIKGINGTEFFFAGIRQQGISNIKSFEGSDICWVEEAQTVTKKSWDVLIPTIRSPNSEIWITFNPDLDTDETYKRFVSDPPDNAVVMKLNWSDNPFFPETLRIEKDALKRRDPEAYDNVWEGNCKAAVEGAIYFKEVQAMERDRRICNVPYDPLLKVHTIWDLGWNDQTSIILAQRNNAEIRIIDYVEDSHRTLDQYIADLRERKLNWGQDWLPHDGASKNIQTGKSSQEILTALGRDVRIVPITNIEEGIRATRMILGRTYVDKNKCTRLMDCIKHYRRMINQNTNEPGAPLHDEYSHGADALRGLGVIADKMTNETWSMKAIKYTNQGIV